MHKLTEQIIALKVLARVDESRVDKIICQYLQERAEWLKEQAYSGIITPKMINQAFELTEPKEKLQSPNLDFKFPYSNFNISGGKNKAKPTKRKLPNKWTDSEMQEMTFPESEKLAKDINAIIEYIEEKED